MRIQGQAVQAAENGLRLKPDSAIGYLCLGCALLGEVYILLGNTDDASREYEILKQLDHSLADDLGKLMSSKT